MRSAAVDLVFRGRRVIRDRALVLAGIDGPDVRAAIGRAVAEGADLIDLRGVPVGADSTLEEELDRVVPAVEWVRETHPGLVIGVTTARPEVAGRACRAGAHLLSDRPDAALLEVAAEFGTGYVCAPGEPAERAAARGVPRAGILVAPAFDPGPELLGQVRALADSDWPVLGTLSGEASDAGVDDRLAGTLAVAALAARAGAAAFRTHRVREVRHVLEMVASIAGDRPPSRAERWLA
ncbi:dihydropteroate synthase [Amycolatopsis anabasis]|uniref:dihydropteroate synthase n=1 Tax=Amycolatopsis anabasis TaxID=1840409 RepID=UPI00131DB85D|nr:dihydropteroate synthase [Amycolatopsis anabasis]